MTQIAADALELPLGPIRFELGDSRMPTAKEHGGSTASASIGPAVREACHSLRAKLRALAGVNVISAEELATALKRAGLQQLSADADSKPGTEKDHHAMYSFGASLPTSMSIRTLASCVCPASSVLMTQDVS